MSNGERIIVKLDPNYNPTGKPMPDTLLKKIKADPDFAKLSEEEQKQVISKVENMIKNVKDVEKYGTLKEKIEKVAKMKCFILNRDGNPFIILPMAGAECRNEIKYIVEGCPVSAGANVLNLMAIDIQTAADLRHNSPISEFATRVMNNSSSNLDIDLDSIAIGGEKKYWVADFKAPIAGKVFSLCEMKNICTKVEWNDDLFIVSSIPDDTRNAAIKWYKETTGKVPKYKTSEDIQEEMATKEANVDNYLSKWDL